MHIIYVNRWLYLTKEQVKECLFCGEESLGCKQHVVERWIVGILYQEYIENRVRLQLLQLPWCTGCLERYLQFLATGIYYANQWYSTLTHLPFVQFDALKYILEKITQHRIMSYVTIIVIQVKARFIRKHNRLEFMHPLWSEELGIQVQG